MAFELMQKQIRELQQVVQLQHRKILELEESVNTSQTLCHELNVKVTTYEQRWSIILLKAKKIRENIKNEREAIINLNAQIAVHNNEIKENMSNFALVQEPLPFPDLQDGECIL